MAETARDIEEEATARWAIRLDGEPLSEAEQDHLDAWIAAEPRRRGALLRAEAALAYLDRGRAAAAPQAGDVRRGLDRRALLVGGSLLSLTVAGAFGLLFSRARAIEIQTAVGEVRRLPLDDGSVASVNTNSRVVVTMRDQRRDVRLEDGEAWFQVAHDKKRPFIVEAGSVRVKAVGTAFSVRRRDFGADVLVTEGLVEAWVVGNEGARTRIAAGSRSFIGQSEPTATVVPAPGDIDRALAWRTGELALNGQSLSYAVEELNRYNIRKLVIDNPALGREQLVGYFRTDQPEAFGRAVASTVGAKVVVEGEKIRLTR